MSDITPMAAEETAIAGLWRITPKAATDELEGKLFGKDFRVRIEQILAGKKK